MSRTLLFVLSLLALGAADVARGGLDSELAAIQSDWAQANYQSPDKQEAIKAFESLAARAHALAAEYPDRTEPLIWEGIVLSSWAGQKGGLGALRLAKEARAKLEAAEKLDPTALDGSVYTSLGALYHKVPGWPVGFGDKDKAKAYLLKALELNPDGIDPNWFYGDFLAEHGKKAEAVPYLERALAAPDRPGRTVADDGRRGEIKDRLAQLKRQQG
jgi:tetratricopeptide (TPR) repeat protein